MHRVSSADLIRNFGVHGDEAVANAVIVTKAGRDRLVLISIEHYEKLKHAYDAQSASSMPTQRRQAT